MSVKNNAIQEKSYSFALRIVKLYQYLSKEKSEYVLSRQVLRSGTSIGANVKEAIGAQTRKDFFLKVKLSYKEARETHYWIRLLRDSKIMEAKLADSLLKDCEENLKLLTAIQKTVRKSLSNKKTLNS